MLFCIPLRRRICREGLVLFSVVSAVGTSLHRGIHSTQSFFDRVEKSPLHRAFLEKRHTQPSIGKLIRNSCDTIVAEYFPPADYRVSRIESSFVQTPARFVVATAFHHLE